MVGACKSISVQEANMRRRTVVLEIEPVVLKKVQTVNGKMNYCTQ